MTDQPKIKRVLVCGGRDFHDREFMFDQLCKISKARGPFECVIHGAAKGADHEARIWATMNKVPHLPFPAAWQDINAPGADVHEGPYGPYNANAGHDRNQRMIDEGKPDAVIAFPGGGGTADMVRRAYIAKIEVIRCKP